jgi:hypothetical protein
MITPIKIETKFVDLHQIREPKTGTWSCNYCNATSTTIQVPYDPYDPNGERKLTLPTEIIRNTSSEGEIIKINEITAKTYKWMDVVDVVTNADNNSNMGLESYWRSGIAGISGLNAYAMSVDLFIRKGSALTFTPTRTSQEMLLQLESYIIDGSLVYLGAIQSTPSSTVPANMSESIVLATSFSLKSVPYYLNPGDAIYGYLRPYASAGSSGNPFPYPSQAVCSLKVNMQTYKDIIIN